MDTKKLKMKDVITVTLLALINVALFFASSLLYMTPVTIVLMPVVFGLLEGIIFFMIGVRVRKRGAILIYCIVRGCIFGGFLPYIILYFVAGVAAELVLWKTGYGNTKGLTAGYVIIQVLASIGSTIYPYALAYESVLQTNAVSDGREGNIQQAAGMLKSWGALLLLAGVVVSSLIGAVIGKRIVKKHLN
ncbi:MAG: MptD family putative ECF transporter S component [Lachnospiraceae bacterium]|nr:MptD family putative ECF transporter S component [Butyrivibrio sp.]MCM1412561.1 MptD family putative ECF transporter S component [Lachnospiraceae bacterium]MCM1542401.1 MptD family putative ECF transporter S component [Blautia sp.]